ncbi:MAG: IS1634 family transposase [Prevotella sp.]|jgi:hypothetical protein|nr:IS1634 family transposase [Prevotella sp.]
MFIKSTKFFNIKNGVTYNKYILARTKKVNGKYKHETILNLGSNFDLDREYWNALISRIETIISKTELLFKPSDKVEKLAQELAPKIVEALNYKDDSLSKKEELNLLSTSIESEMEVLTVGVSYLAITAFEHLGYKKIMEELGFPPNKIKMAIALVAARMERPGSEAATYRWLSRISALGTLLGIDFTKKSIMSLYRPADDIIRHQEEIESAFSRHNNSLFSNSSIIYLYDLTNVYFEGHPKSNKAKLGHSKEKRTDCLLESIAIFLDQNGYIKNTKFYPGNVSEPKTLQEMLDLLNPAAGIPILMDRGIASADNLKILLERNLNFIVVNREHHREFDKKHKYTTIETKSKHEIKIYRKETIGKINDEIPDISDWKGRLTKYCIYSSEREKKETAINNRLRQGFENGLYKIHQKIKNSKKLILESVIMKKIGALEKQYAVGQHFYYKVETEMGVDKNYYVKDIIYKFKPLDNTKMTHPGVYSLLTNLTNKSENEIWDIFNLSTRIESVFRMLKSDLGLRPIYHYSELRIDAHLFISILAYQCVNYIREILKSHNITYEWTRIIEEMSNNYLIEKSYKLENGKIIKRYSYKLNNFQKQIYDIFKLNYLPQGI